MITKLHKLVCFFSFCPYWSLGAIWHDITRNLQSTLWR
nr:MAG TPA: Dynein heavy chain AAA lid domain [Caudoviricetes sp.]